MTTRILLLATLMLVAAPAGAGDREDYNRRAAAADVAVFHALDRDGDGLVTREEAQGEVDFVARFDDIDIGRDGAISVSELRRYVEARYEVGAETVGVR